MPPVEHLQGRTAYQWTVPIRFFGRLMFLSIGIGLLVLVLGIYQTALGSIFLFVSVGLLAASVFAVMVLRFIVNAREMQEAALGYTTLPASHRNLVELDPETMTVIRAAGEPYLDPSLRQMRLAKTAPLPANTPMSASEARKHWGPLKRPGDYILFGIGITAPLASLAIKTFGP